jgi:hypothetical protein
LRLKEDEKWAVFPVLKTRISGKIVDQIIFNPDKHNLLISAVLVDQIWDLGAKSMICEKARKDLGERSGQWINHPFDETRLLLVEQIGYISRWRNLKGT